MVADTFLEISLGTKSENFHCFYFNVFFFFFFPQRHLATILSRLIFSYLENSVEQGDNRGRFKSPLAGMLPRICLAFLVGFIDLARSDGPDPCPTGGCTLDQDCMPDYFCLDASCSDDDDSPMGLTCVKL